MRLIVAMILCSLASPLRAEEPERPLVLRAWLGGTEPGTSKQAFEAQASYRPAGALELAGGGSWTDNIFYAAYKGFAEGSWFYEEFSYLRAAFTFRSYDYTGASRPTPDSNAYKTVPRPELEISHWLTKRVRVAANYQLFLPNFQYDPGTRFANHKLSGEVEVKLGAGFSASLMGAMLRDPSPGRTRIVNRHLPAGMAPDTAAAAPDYACATDQVTGLPIYCAGRTQVVQRTELLLGGGLAYDSSAWGASVRYIPNRDLDSGFDWSIVTGLELRPADRLSFNLMWIHDRYSPTSGAIFAGKDGDVWWATVRYAFTPALAAGGGLKWVKNPGPGTTAGDLPRRDDATLLLQLEYRVAL